MTKRISTWVMALMAVAFSSCLDLGDNTDYVQDYICMATVTTGGINPIFQMDEGFFLVPEAAMPADTFTVGERYYLHFVLGDTTNHPLNTYPVNFYRYGKTSMKEFVVLPKDSTDRWENKPVNMSNFWYSGHYLNFSFLSYAGTGTPNTFELVRVLDNESTTPTDTFPKLHFELRHNVNNYSTSYLYYRYYSFDLDSLKTQFPNATKFKIKVNWNDVTYGARNVTSDYIPDQVLTTVSLVSTSKKMFDPLLNQTP